jgi:hypothetical protein
MGAAIRAARSDPGEQETGNHDGDTHQGDRYTTLLESIEKVHGVSEASLAPQTRGGAYADHVG